MEFSVDGLGLTVSGCGVLGVRVRALGFRGSLTPNPGCQLEKQRPINGVDGRGIGGSGVKKGAARRSTSTFASS